MSVAALLERLRATRGRVLSPAEQARQQRDFDLRWDHGVQIDVLAAYALLWGRTFVFFGGRP